MFSWSSVGIVIAAAQQLAVKSETKVTRPDLEPPDAFSIASVLLNTDANKNVMIRSHGTPSDLGREENNVIVYSCLVGLDRFSLVLKVYRAVEARLDLNNEARKIPTSV